MAKQVTNELVVEHLSKYLDPDGDNFVSTVSEIIFLIDEDPFDINNEMFFTAIVEYFDGEDALNELYEEWDDEEWEDEELEEDED